jgi:hypothetical protein
MAARIRFSCRAVTENRTLSLTRSSAPPWSRRRYRPARSAARCRQHRGRFGQEALRAAGDAGGAAAEARLITTCPVWAEVAKLPGGGRGPNGVAERRALLASAVHFDDGGVHVLIVSGAARSRPDRRRAAHGRASSSRLTGVELPLGWLKTPPRATLTADSWSHGGHRNSGKRRAPEVRWIATISPTSPADLRKHRLVGHSRSVTVNGLSELKSHRRDAEARRH